MKNTTVLIILTFILNACHHKSNKADLVVVNAEIWTGDVNNPQAEAMAIKGDLILAVGNQIEINKHIGKNTKTLNAKGQFITPGFIDSHVHLLDGGFTLSSVQLRDAKTPQEFSRRIGEYAKTLPEGTWILGSDWDGSEWDELPSKQWIDHLTPKHPIFLARFDGHIGIANSLAMQLAEVDDRVADVEGGSILRDSLNQLTGIFKDNAMTLITNKIPTPTDQQFDRALKKAMQHFNSMGVTSVHHMWYPTDLIGNQASFERAFKKNELSLRIYSLDALEDWSMVDERNQKNRMDSNWLKIHGLKGVFDGALGSHTAAFLEPFTDDPSDQGTLMLAEDKLYDWSLNADKNNLQLAIHAIGDRANRVLLDTFKNIATKNGAKDRRFRVEHAQHLAAEDINRFAELDVIASMQPYHAIDDGRWAEKVIGSERIKTTYAFNSLMESGAKVAFGSDWPVAPASVLEGIYAAVTRRTIDDKNPEGWVPEQKVVVEQALNAYTINGAFASFEERIKGSLEKGKLADFVILNRNLLEVDSIEIKDLKVMKTYLGGKMVYDSGFKE